VRCKEGLVLGWEDKPVPYAGNFYYFPEHARCGRQQQGMRAARERSLEACRLSRHPPNTPPPAPARSAPDTQGRTFPGNPAEKAGYV
jgi:hypothetical protein